MSVEQHQSVPQFLAHCGDQGRAVAGFDWSATPLGAIDSWPECIKSTLSLMLHANVPMAVLWGETGILLHNKAFGTLVGKPDFSALGCSLLELFPQFSVFMRDVIRSVLSGKTVAERDMLTMLERDGKFQEVWVNQDYSPIVDDNGAVCAVFAIIKDTTERIRIEQRLNFAQEAGGVGTFEWYPDKGTLDVSDEYRRIWGLDPHVEVTDAMLVSLLHPDDATKSGTHKRDSDNPLAYVEYRRICPQTNEIRWLARQGRVISATGVSVRRFVGTVTDITARKQAEAALRDAEERFRTLAQSMTNLLWTARPDGLLSWCNGRIHEYVGAGDEAVLGEAWGQHLHPDDVASVALAWSEALRTGSMYETELRLRRFDGTFRWFITRATPIRDESGKIIYWIGSNTDIEAQKRAESELAALAIELEARVETRTAELAQTQEILRQSQKMEAIGNLTGGIAHDFNNLLQVVGGNLELLRRHIADQPQAVRHAQNAMEGVERGAHLAAQLLAFGRRQALAPKVVNVGKLLHGVEDMLRRVLGVTIELKTIVHNGAGKSLIDPVNLENAILNLSINARDAMEGVGKLTIEAANVILDASSATKQRELAPGQYVMVSVTDTGHGMPKELLEKVFDPFFTTKPQGKGSGLGLSMVYGFVKQSGGQVRLYSEPGEGTTVRLYLPSSTDTEDDVAEVDYSPVIGGHETILVVEDDEAVRATVVAQLSDLGYTVLTAKDASSGIDIVESQAALDLILTDVIMPGPVKVDALAQRAQALLPHAKIIFTSGYTEGAIVHSGRLSDGIAFLAKPYNHETLARKVRSVLGPPKNAVPMEVSMPTANESRALTILLCEDDMLIRMNMLDIIEDFGHTGLEAGNGAEALELSAQHAIDMLITDVGLPDISGVELANRLREINTLLPVLFASGHSHIAGVTLDARTAVLQKPFTVDMLGKAIAALA